MSEADLRDLARSTPYALEEWQKAWLDHPPGTWSTLVLAVTTLGNPPSEVCALFSRIISDATEAPR